MVSFPCPNTEKSSGCSWWWRLRNPVELSNEQRYTHMQIYEDRGLLPIFICQFCGEWSICAEWDRRIWCRKLGQYIGWKMDRERFSALREPLDTFQEQLVTSISPTLMSCRAGGVLSMTRTDPDSFWDSCWVISLLWLHICRWWYAHFCLPLPELPVKTRSEPIPLVLPKKKRNWASTDPYRVLIKRNEC